jgi:hypothetical protein
MSWEVSKDGGCEHNGLYAHAVKEEGKEVGFEAWQVAYLLPDFA